MKGGSRIIFAISLFLFLLLFLLYFYFAKFGNENGQAIGPKPCQKRSYGKDSFVCVCTAEYCDQPESIDEGDLAEGKLVFYVTTKDQYRLQRFVANLEEETDGQKETGIHEHENLPESTVVDATVVVDPAGPRFQTIQGFGGAFTDSAGININSLSDGAKRNLLSAYFDPDVGIGYTLGRVPIGGTDFSTRGYSYLDTPDNFNLSTFKLAKEDFEQKIPLILAANKLTKGGAQLRLLASPWSAPAWMKTNGNLQFGGRLKGEPINGQYYQTYAKYLSRFLEEYAANGVPFWTMSLQNEPELAEMKGLNRIPTMFMSNHTQREFAHDVLKPLLRQSAAGKDVKIVAFDDMRPSLLAAALEIYSDQTTANKEDAIDGIGFHWYTHSPFADITAVHNHRPEKFLLATEACTGLNKAPSLGEWHRGWLYGWDILNTLKHWTIGWIDWNLCLDVNGGPSWVKNRVDSPIIVNGSADEFYKQSMFYFMGHFSRFIPRNSVRIDSALLDAEGTQMEDTFEGRKIVKQFEELMNATFYVPSPSIHQPEHVAFETPDGNIVLVLINQEKAEKEGGGEGNKMAMAKNIRLRDAEMGRSWLLRMEPDSILTAIWRRNNKKEEEEKERRSNTPAADRSNL